ncbi:MAG: hypothetical protein ABGY75_04160 [Gemmataceae bacterium]
MTSAAMIQANVRNGSSGRYWMTLVFRQRYSHAFQLAELNSFSSVAS